MLYRVLVEAGETLQIQLDALSDAGANELYVRYEGLPNSIQNDAAYPGYLTADQVATVPRTSAGYYYILARAQGAADTVRLRARLVPLGISAITPDSGGADRYVTVTITGSKFSDAASVKLLRPTFAEYSPVNYRVIDATKIIATFDLRNAMVGLYDVVVTNPDGQSVQIPYRFLISQPMPYDLSVGLGGPAELFIDLSTGTSPAVYGTSALSLTNVDMPYVHFEFGVPRLENKMKKFGVEGEALAFGTTFNSDPLLSGVNWSLVDPTLNEHGRLKVQGYVFDLVNKGFAGTSFALQAYPGLQAKLKEDPNFLTDLVESGLLDPKELGFKFYIYVASTPMTAQEYVGYQTSQAARIRDLLLLDVDAPRTLKTAAAEGTAWTALYLRALTDAGLLRPEDVPPAIREDARFVAGISTVAAGLLGQPGGTPVILEGSVELATGKGFLALLRRWMGETPDEYGSADLPTLADFDLNLSRPTHFEAFTIRVGVPDLAGDVVEVEDVNQRDLFGLAGRSSPLVRVSGPNGFGPLGFVPLANALPYTLSYTHPAGASGAVGELRLLQLLDSEASVDDFDVDVRSFRLGDVQLGDLFLALRTVLPPQWVSRSPHWGVVNLEQFVATFG